MTKARMTKPDVVLENVVILEATFPEVPMSIDKAQLVDGDADPFFVTLPIGSVGAKSRNGRVYTRGAVDNIVEAIQQRRVGGIKGHLRDEDRAHKFDLPSLIWVGSMLSSDGTLYGKAYVPRYAEDVREYLRIAQVSNAPVGTSIYGTGTVDEMGNVTALNVESIDLAHPSRVGIPHTAAVPKITQEMMHGDTMKTDVHSKLSGMIDAYLANNGDETRDGVITRIASSSNVDVSTIAKMLSGESMPTDDVLQAFASVLGENTTLTPPVGASRGKRKSMPATEERVTQEMTDQNNVGVATPHPQKAEDFAVVAELRDELQSARRDSKVLAEIRRRLGEPEDVIGAIQALQFRVDDLKKENGELLQETIEAMVTRGVKVPTMRKLIIEMVKRTNPVTRADIEFALAKTLRESYIKEMMQEGVEEVMGETHTRPVATPSASSDDETRIHIPV